MRSWSSPGLTRPLSCFLAIVFVLSTVSIAAADVVVLRSGERYEGAIANRELYTAQQIPSDRVAIYSPGAGGIEAVVHRFDLGEVDVIILEDDGAQRVIDPRFFDLSDLEQAVPLRFRPVSERASLKRATRIKGYVFLGVGLGLAVGGAIARLGDQRFTSRGDGFVSHRDYNAVNYLMMASGAVATAAGFVLISKPIENSDGTIIALQWQF